MIDKTAVISKKAHIASDVEIGAYTVIGDYTKIKSGTKIGNFCDISNCTIGHNNIIKSYVCIGSEGQGGVTAPDGFCYVEIGDRNVIRERAIISRGTFGRGNKTKIGENCEIMGEVHIGHDCFIGDETILVEKVSLGGNVQIGEKCYIGGSSVIHQDSKIGKCTVIGGFSCTRMDVLPYSVIDAFGIPMKIPNIDRLKKEGFSLENRNLARKIFKILYDDKYTITSAIEYIKNNFESNKLIDDIVEFVELSERGILKKNKYIK